MLRNPPKPCHRGLSLMLNLRQCSLLVGIEKLTSVKTPVLTLRGYDKMRFDTPDSPLSD